MVIERINMTVDAYVTIWLGIAATFLAAVINLVAGYFRSQAEHRRELAKLAKELALSDLEDARRRHTFDEAHEIRPTSSYVWFYYWFLRKIDRKSFDEAKLDAHLDEYEKLLSLYKKHSVHAYKPKQDGDHTQEKTPNPS